MNHLANQTSPYLLQHAENPVEWYPWGEEAFARARKEDKPVFLSIGYSTCHWCHVMAHESFEDEEIAKILNQDFVSIKVDKEERPDIDSIYMAVCQAFTGSGGWPTTIFMTPDQKPFFAGTYFPKTARFGQIGLKELLKAVKEKWENNRESLFQSAEEVIALLGRKRAVLGDVEEQLIGDAVRLFRQSFDRRFGGFGEAPKFPAPHNLLFLMRYYEKSKDKEVLQMVERTLTQMYRGGIFDHIGGGFSRYSTDRYFLVPHFEKMLYDNALLILAYCKCGQITKNEIYVKVAEWTADFVLREMTSPEGGFYSAQDADSEGVEGKFYLFEPSEIVEILGEKEGTEFNRWFDITEKGNFEGKSIPNLLRNSSMREEFGDCLSAVYQYRKKRYVLHMDDKILNSWNGLMIAAMCHLYRVTGKQTYLQAAMYAEDFIERKLCEGDVLYISYRDGKRSGRGLLDDYANGIFALLALYEATLEKGYLKKAQRLCDKVIDDFYDDEFGGFFLYGKENEQLILRPKETYDGAMFSGNSAMAYNFLQLYYLTEEQEYWDHAEQQMRFMSAEAGGYPAGYAMFLVALSDYMDPPEKVTCVLKDGKTPEKISCRIPLDSVIRVMEKPTEEYPLKNDQTTFYVCCGHSCQPPVNRLDEEFMIQKAEIT